jgi:predicted Rossmann fold flavoprotein
MKPHAMYDILVIGAGPAGLFAAINCAQGGMSVCILEKNNTPAKKLLLSGSGQCNITNAADISEFDKHYGPSARFVKPSLYNFSNKDLIAYFESKNLNLKIINDGKIFPESLRAKDVLDILLADCTAHRIEIKYGEPVQKVIHTDDGFVTETKTTAYASKKLIITTGGKSYPSTGSTGDGYRFAASLGHMISETAPSLTSIMVKDYALQECSGIAIRNGCARIIRNGKTIHEQTGDILFTHKGLSGPCILDMSRYVQRDDCITIQMTRIKQPEEFENILVDGSRISGNKSVKNFIATYDIPERIITALMKAASLDSDIVLARLDKKSRRMLAENVTGMPFLVEKTGAYNDAMATRGGIALNEINPKSMESKIIEGLYFAGEVIDVDGDTGGYNLQFAFSSAKCAADHILKYELQKKPV